MIKTKKQLRIEANDAHMDRQGHPLSLDQWGICSTCKRNSRTHSQATRMCVSCNRSQGDREFRFVMHHPYHYPACP